MNADKVELLNRLKNQIANRQNIGLALIDLLDDHETIEYIHKKSESILKNAARAYIPTVSSDADIVFISLCLIGLQHYKSGNFYDAVENQYEDLYSNYSRQKIEGIIRSVLNKFQTGSSNKKSRVINIALINALVPIHYLPAFFEFIFDIYCLNFNRDIPDDIYDEFKFAFDGINTSLREDSDVFKVTVTNKSYKLIQTTKNIISNDKWVEQLIQLSINVVTIINAWYWQEKKDLINSYYEFGFDNWNKPTERGGKRQSSTNHKHSRSAWKPEYRLCDNSIYLKFPVHKVKKHYDYKQIYGQLIIGDQKIKLPDPKITEIVGGYQIIVDDQSINNPLSQIEYKLMCGDDVIYSSDHDLCRNYIVFDSNGYELDNNCDYDGDAFFCVANVDCTDSIGSIIQKTDYYCLTQKSVKKGDSVFINDELFCFSRIIRPDIYGDCFDMKDIL